MSLSSTTKKKEFRYSSQNWLGKSIAGLVLGFLLSLGFSGIILNYGFDQVELFSTESQFSMWLISPIWMLIVSFCFLFRTGLRAWIYLSAANIIIWAPLLVPPASIT